MKKYVFVMGSGRSGTTMVRDVLGNHPEICSLPETSFFDRLWAARFFMGKLSKKNSRLKFVWLFFYACGDRLIVNFNKKMELMANKYADADFFTHKNLYTLMCDSLSEEHENVVVEKTPHHLLFMDFIAQRYPEAKFIYITRDPVDMVNSYISRGDLPSNYKQVAMEWVVGNEIGLMCLKKYPDRVVHIRYEDIIDNPIIAVEKLFNFIGKSFNERYLNIKSNSTFDKSDSIGIHKKIQESRILPKEKSIEIRKLTAGISRSFGYPEEQPNLFDLWEWVFRFKYKFKYWLCLSGFRPMRIMMDRNKMLQMKNWVDKYGCSNGWQ